MATDSQIDANRGNAQHSTGPKTDEGKAASARNSFRHGLSAGAFRLLEGENPQDFIDLANGFLREHKPVTPTESELVTTMAQSAWRRARACRLQDELLESNSPDKELFALYLRYQTTHNNSFSKALNDLLKLRRDVRQRETGFVSQTQKQEMHIARIHNVNARTASKEFDLHLKKTRHAPAPAQAPATGGTQQAA